MQFSLLVVCLLFYLDVNISPVLSRKARPPKTPRRTTVLYTTITQGLEEVSSDMSREKVSFKSLSGQESSLASGFREREFESHPGRYFFERAILNLSRNRFFLARPSLS
uniref:Uncharacterized protein n=1 Tax=Cacopsylla melanoneura TaxID=428564 RepID=A0A8D8YZI7_9HEMI